jgi:hypothetical protein
VSLLHKLYGDDMDGMGALNPSILGWVCEQELEYADYARQILERLDGSKQPDMVTWDDVNMAGKRAPLVLHALHRAFSFRPTLKRLLDLLAKQTHTATATPAALMLAQMQGDSQKLSFDWPMMYSLWGALKARMERTKRYTLPRDEFVAEIVAQQGGTNTPDRQETLKALFAEADPDNSGIVDARDCCAVICRGITNGHENRSAQIEANVVSRLDFFRGLYEGPIGAAGPNGPAIALNRMHYVKVLDRLMDEQKQALTDVLKGLQAVRIMEGRLDAKYVTEKAKAEPEFEAQLTSML